MLDKADGHVLRKEKHIIENPINSYECIDSLFILQLFENNNSVPVQSHYVYAILNLEGKIIGKAENQNSHNLPDSLILSNPTHMDIQYLGVWKNNYLFWAWYMITPGPNGDGYYKVYFEDKHGKIIGVSTFNKKIFGATFYLTTDELKKLRNGKIYILGQDGKNALITELSVEELYKDAIQHKQ